MERGWGWEGDRLGGVFGGREWGVSILIPIPSYNKISKWWTEVTQETYWEPYTCLLLLSS